MDHQAKIDSETITAGAQANAAAFAQVNAEKRQPWKAFFELEEPKHKSDIEKGPDGKVRLLPELDDKDLGG